MILGDEVELRPGVVAVDGEAARDPRAGHELSMLTNAFDQGASTTSST